MRRIVAFVLSYISYSISFAQDSNSGVMLKLGVLTTFGRSFYN